METAIISMSGFFHEEDIVVFIQWESELFLLKGTDFFKRIHVSVAQLDRATAS